MGGKDKVVEVFQYFYFLFMTDPFMNTLFDMSHEDSNKDHTVHG